MEIRNENKVFFGENGITSTSATYLCNIARELLKDIESSLNNVSFINEEVSILGSGEVFKTKEGYNSSELLELDSKLLKAAELKAFIAWMSEGIKAKDEEQQRLSKYSIQDFVSDFPEYKFPQPEIIPVESQYGIAKLSVSERVKYLFSEALTSSIGKYIHNNGKLKEAYNELLNIAHNKLNVTTEAKDALVLITNKVPSVDTKEVEKVMLKYQNIRRENEKVLNSLKSKVKKYDRDYQLERNLRDRRENERQKEEFKLLNSKYDEYVLNMTSKIENLKIIIPLELEGVYNTLQKLSKDK